MSNTTDVRIIEIIEVLLFRLAVKVKTCSRMVRKKLDFC